MNKQFRKKIKKYIPERWLMLYTVIPRPEDISVIMRFIFSAHTNISFSKRLWLVYKSYSISFHIENTHLQSFVIPFVQEILTLPENVPGCVVEAGSFKGASTAKFSLAAKLAGRKLYVLDSFAGLPENNEPVSKNIYGKEFIMDVPFPGGAFNGTLDEVKANIKKYGCIEVCEFIQGWYEETMPNFKEPVAAAFIDVDLASSTRVCLKYLFPLLQTGGSIYSQDGHLPNVVALLKDQNFWKDELGIEQPQIDGLGEKVLVRIKK